MVLLCELLGAVGLRHDDWHSPTAVLLHKCADLPCCKPAATVSCRQLWGPSSGCACRVQRQICAMQEQRGKLAFRHAQKGLLCIIVGLALQGGGLQ